MKVLILTLPNQIYATIILRGLFAKKYDIIGIATSTALMPGKSMLQGIRKIVRDSGIVYLCLRLCEEMHNRYLQLTSPAIYSSVNKFAVINSIPIYPTESVSDPSFLHLANSLAPDIIVSIYFNEIIKKQLLEIPKYGCINIHRALLPKYRGPCSAFWQLANGEKVSGVTIHYIDEGTDTGDIILQQRYDITPQDTHHTLCVRSARISSALLSKALKKSESGNVAGTLQDNDEATCFPFPTKESARDFLKRKRRMF